LALLRVVLARVVGDGDVVRLATTCDEIVDADGWRNYRRNVL
jgi:hypothetical protein